MQDTRATASPLRAAILTLACVAVMVSTALPDVVYLKNGGKVEGRVTERETDILLVTSSGGNITIPKSDIERIEYKDLPVKPPKQPAKPDEKPPVKPGEEKPGETNPPAAAKLGEPVHDPLLGFRCRFPFGWRRLPQQSQTTLMTFIGLREPGYPPKIDIEEVDL
ncbi:MAG: hypothetical protein RDV41_13315, partial [Planctomycetota bacterium]|nr:hypothetical protein [Planctomycetota bacterium]